MFAARAIVPGIARAFLKSAPLVAVCAGAAGADVPDEPLPGYVAKPATWTTMIVPHEGDPITDVQFATWVKDAQIAANDPAFGPEGTRGRREMTIVCDFTQCFSGGFLTEMKKKEIKGFGATSACKFFQAAFYKEGEFGYFARAWTAAAKGDLRAFDDVIARKAWNLMDFGQEAENPGRAIAQVQYLNDNGGASKLRPGDKGIALIFAGDPTTADAPDITRIYELLTDKRSGYKFAPENIRILYGDGTTPGGVKWKANAAATADKLNKSITAATTEAGGFVLPRLAAAPVNDKLQLFVWVADHGTARVPFSITVSPVSKGTAGDVKARSGAGKKVESVVYEAGSRTNTAHFVITKDAPKREADAAGNPNPLPNEPEVVAISFANDVPEFLGSNPPPFSIYFNVDRATNGVANSGVKREKMRSSASSDTFIATDNSNRQMTPGPEMGIRKDKKADKQDDVVGLSEKSISTVIPAPPEDGQPADIRMLTAPLFFVVKGSSKIHVYDPARNSTYVWWDWSAVDVGENRPPRKLDGLAIRTELNRDPPSEDDRRAGIPGRLFMSTVDLVYFSVPRDGMFEPTKEGPAGPDGMPTRVELNPLPAACDIWVFPAMFSETPPYLRYRTCEQVGLVKRTAEVEGDNMLDFALVGDAIPARIAGMMDVNHDGRIDLADLQEVLNRWNTADGDAGYSRDADINADGVIDVADVEVFTPWLVGSRDEGTDSLDNPVRGGRP